MKRKFCSHLNFRAGEIEAEKTKAVYRDHYRARKLQTQAISQEGLESKFWFLTDHAFRVQLDLRVSFKVDLDMNKSGRF